MTRQVATLAGCLTLLSGLCLAQLSLIKTSAASTYNFVCGSSTYNGAIVPATVAQTPRGNVTVIRWVSSYFNTSGYDPLTRCNHVSDRFQLYNTKGTLKFLTTGRMNGMPVICTTDFLGGGCQQLLFTLKPTSNRTPAATLQDLMQIRIYGGPALNETNDRLYINMDEFLSTAPIESTALNNPTLQETYDSSSNDKPLIDPLW